MDYNKLSLDIHEKNKGKIQVVSKVKVENREDLSVAYTPGVAEPCRRISENKEDVYKYTAKGNLVAVVSDGSAVLGLGDIGPEAAMPVMEGKAILFKEFADIDAFPICLATKDVNEIVKTVKYLAPTFGGINLEDISAPRCFEIERILKKELDIPVFHDDQHGTAIVVLAGIINALKLVNKSINEANVVINGAGSAGISICKLLLEVGIGNVVLVDMKGALAVGEQWMNPEQTIIAEKTNKYDERGSLQEIIKGKDIFIGVSAPNIVSAEMVSTMATGRSDFPTQINNVLVFPGIFRGALDVRAKDITEEMKIAAAKAIASIVTDEELSEEYIIPNAFDKRVVKAVSASVSKAAYK